MRFNPKARLDTSRVRDGGRGSGGGLGSPGGGGMRIPMPGGTKAGGGVGLVLIIVVLILSQCSGIDLTGALNGTGAAGYSTSRLSRPSFVPAVGGLRLSRQQKRRPEGRRFRSDEHTS